MNIFIYNLFILFFMIIMKTKWKRNLGYGRSMYVILISEDK